MHFYTTTFMQNSTATSPSPRRWTETAHACATDSATHIYILIYIFFIHRIVGNSNMCIREPIDRYECPTQLDSFSAIELTLRHIMGIKLTPQLMWLRLIGDYFKHSITPKVCISVTAMHWQANKQIHCLCFFYFNNLNPNYLASGKMQILRTSEYYR